MATKIVTKSGSGAPTTDDLIAGELAVDLTNKRLYTEDSGGTVLELGTNPASDVTFGDNTKAIFGAGSDLQIYHDGSHSYVSDQGTGDLRILAADFRVRNAADDETMIQANADTDVSLWYNNSKKLATTNTGIDITGSVTADAIVIEPSDAQIQFNATAYKIKGGGFYGDMRFEAPRFRFYESNGVALQIDNNDISFYEDTGTTPKFFWDSSDESLLLSKSSGLALQVGANNSTLAGAEFRYSTVPAYITNSVASSPITIHATFSINQYDNTEGTADSWSSPSNANYNSAAVQLTSTTGGSEIRFFTEAGEAGIDQKMVINSAGSVGIGTDSPSTFNASNAAGKLVVGSGSGNEGITVYSGTTSTGALCFADGTTSTDTYKGYVQYNHNTNSMQFATGHTEAMRIDASGNLLVGVTSLTGANGPRDTTTTAGLGVGLNYYGGVYAAAYQSSPFVSNRISTDGELFTFKKDGAPVGSIGTISSDLEIHSSVSGHVGLRFANGGIFPTDNTGTVTNGEADIGNGSFRFKDLFLSGGVVFGATGGSVSSKTLDDYEEGTWNGVITDGTNNATMADTECFYTKTGRLVTLSGDISTSALGSVAGSSIRISGVPFTNGAKGVSAAIGRASGLAITAGYVPTLYFDASSSALRLGLFDNAGGTTTLQATEWTDDGQISFSITYMTS